MKKTSILSWKNSRKYYSPRTKEDHLLIHINVNDIALIDEVSLELHENLNILTGETGAGKSMIIDSINFALGGRTPRSIIRRGEKSALVELLFDLNSKDVNDKLEELGIDQEEHILISRKLYATGRTIYKINGQTVTRKMLKQISVLLLDVHGQHEHQSLLNTSKHIDLLDKFGGKELANNLDQLASIYDQYVKLEKELDHLMGDDKTRIQMIDMLQFQIKEIKEAGLKIGEDTSLMEDMKILGNAEKIKENLQQAYDFLHAQDTGTMGVIGTLGEAIAAISNISDINDDLGQIHKDLENIEMQLWEIIPEVRTLNENIEYDPETLFEVQQRLDLIITLKRKYGDTTQEILSHYDQLKKDLKTLQNSDEKREKLNQEMAVMEAKMTKICAKISKIRMTQAKEVSSRIEKELHELQIENAQFQIKVSQRDHIKSNGIDDVEFMISTNIGEPMQSLGKIVSGGEMSRIMLALKTILADVDDISTLIFDEIDTGISGRTAQKVAEKLAIIAKRHQVICITHLPQIAAMSDYHYLIEKSIDNSRPNTHVALLKEDHIIEEISRLMAGATITATTMKNAKEIKSMATQFKETL